MALVSWFSWSNWARFYRALWRVQGPRALPEAALRAGLALAHGASWATGRDAPTPRALIVVGHQRSGTTWLHRMLAACPGAASLPLHGLVFPADAIQRPLALAPRPAWFDRLQDRLLGGMDPLHRIRLHEPEEDEFLLWALFRSPMNALDRPWPPGANPEIDGDDVAIRFYAQAIARAARRSGSAGSGPGSGWYVGKNPHFTHRIPELRAAIPGVKIVQLGRHPAEAIPSRLSLIRAIWNRRFPGFGEPQPHHVERIYRSSLRCYRGGLDGADLDLSYTDLLADPVGSVGRVLALLGLDPPDPTRRGRLLKTRRAGRTPHRYTLAEFGLSREQLASDLLDVYERWGFDP